MGLVGRNPGRLNHARLTPEPIRHSVWHFAGRTTTPIDPGVRNSVRNLATLPRLLAAKSLGLLPFIDSRTDGEQMHDALAHLCAAV